jgi:AraC-like DNA-binding protein
LRRDLALARVEKPIDSLTDIASGLGYSDFSAFFRAFKSWTGMAPSEYRAMKNLLHREEMPV